MRTKPMLALLFASTVLVASAGGLGEARAGDIERARKVFAEGVRLYRSGDWEGARRLFREADAEHHAAVIAYNIGLVEEKLGHPQSAVDAYEAYIAEGGDGNAEFASAAATAIAQIKARSTRLRLETSPPGARLFLDGTPIVERAPTNVLVPAGHHVVVAALDEWREERTVEVRGAGDALTVAFEATRATASAAPASSAEAAPRETEPRAPDRDLATKPQPALTAENGADGVTWGASFAMVPIYLLGVTDPAANNARPAPSILAGAFLELGWALTDDFEFLARGFVGIGPDGHPSYGYLGGPGLSYRVAPRLWIGATFIGGQIETKAHDVRYGTDIVFGTTLEASVVVLKKSHGEWLAGLQPSVLVTEIRQDNTAIFVPLTFGYRSY
jgi:hypothetical protein